MTTLCGKDSERPELKKLLDFVILQRQAEGLAIAKKLRKCKGRKKIEVEKAKFRSVYEDWKTGKTTAVMAMARLNLTRNTFYRRVKEFEVAHGDESSSPVI